MPGINISNLDPALAEGVAELIQTVPFEISDGAPITLTAKRSTENRITITDNLCHITYSKTPAFYKGFAQFLADAGSADKTFNADFEKLGAMFDCSRNAVLSVNGAKKMIRYLALMGYDFIMLYTEDTIEVPEYPHFGYMRGRFAQSEIKEIDAYCRIFGIELIPYIQTLAHLNQAFNWQPFRDIHDIDDVLLIDNDATYEFLDKLIASCAAAYTSRAINIGMDEAYHVGLGRFLDEHGFSDRVMLILRHLERVAGICEKYGLKPMMWSDMFFRLLYGDYFEFDEDAARDKKPPEIPQNVALIYWDYFSHDKARYDKFFKAHLRLSDNIMFAGGAWTWKGMTPDNAFSIPAAKAALASARDNGITTVFACMWGDDGGECSPLAVLPALLTYSEENYHTGIMEREFLALTGLPFGDYLTVDRPAKFPEIPADCSGINPAKYLLFQDILGGLFDKNFTPGYVTQKYKDDAAALRGAAEKASGDIKQLFMTHALLCDVLAVKAELGRSIRQAYPNGKNKLAEISNNVIPELIKKTEVLYENIKKTWLLLNKPHGLDMQDLRFGGLIQRFKTVKGFIDAYLAGGMDAIPVLDEEILSYSAYGMSEEGDYVYVESWIKMYSANVPYHS